MDNGFYFSGKSMILISIFEPVNFIEQIMRRFFKKIVFVVGLLLVAINICAQKNQFIYIQAENKQAFYVQLADQLYNSGAEGYLIIPKLSEGTYELSIRFPKDEWPPQNVTCIMKEADMGFVLKYYGDRGWGLINLQTMQVAMAKKDTGVMAEALPWLASDSFSIILASVVNDPGILRRSPAINDTVIVGAEQTKEGNRPDTASKKNAVNKEAYGVLLPQVKKLQQDTSAGGITMLFLDASSGQPDTVSVFIPVIGNGGGAASSQGTRKEVPGDLRLINAELPGREFKADSGTVLKDSISAVEKKADIHNAKCKQTASHADFVSLQKRMAAKRTDNERINEGLKKFRVTCYTTEQVKNLGDLFFSDEGKYKLYVAAYPFTSDRGKFNSLQSQLKDEYFVSRFRAMLGQ